MNILKNICKLNLFVVFRVSRKLNTIGIKIRLNCQLTNFVFVCRINTLVFTKLQKNSIK